MGRENGPSDPLSRFFGVNITDTEELRRLFSRKAEGQESWPPAADVVVSRQLYLKYLRLYDLSCFLVQALGDVLDDAEHKLVVAEAEELGYTLPDIKRFQKELDAYRSFLENLDAYQVRQTATGRIRVPHETADALYKLTEYNCFMVGHIFDGCFNTEYMKHFGTLKRSGAHYAGATALQEAVNVLVGMIRIKEQIDLESEFRVLLKDDDYLKGPQP